MSTHTGGENSSTTLTTARHPAAITETAYKLINSCNGPLFIFHFSFFILYAFAFFSVVKTPLYKIGRAYGTLIDDL